jgi:protein TonB
MAAPTAVPSPPAQATGPTSAMTEAQFKEEVARRVAQELKRIEQDARRPAPAAPSVRPRNGEPAAGTAPTSASGKADAGPASAAPARSEPAAAPPPTLPPASAAAEPTAAPTPVPAAIAPAAAPTAPPSPAPAAAPPTVETPPQISRIVKPIYPAFALRARIGGTVILRVHVTEDGRAGQIEVVRGVAGGLTESAVNAVRNWRFEPARRGGVAVPGLITIPIPFEP